MASKLLTPRKLESLKVREREYLEHDGDGLYVRVRPNGTPKGSQVWQFVYTRPSGGRGKIVLGAVADHSLAKAREWASVQRAMLDHAIDPQVARQEEADARVAEKAKIDAAQIEREHKKRFTLRALCQAYSEILLRAGKEKSAAGSRSTFKCHVFDSYPECADLPANEVTPHQIAAMIRKVREAGKERAAGVLRSNLSAAYNVAKRAPFDSALPAALIEFDVQHNPVDSIPAIPVRAGDRTLSEDELRIYMASLGLDIADQALSLALLSGGQRMAQLLRVKVSDYDSVNQILRLWDRKGRRLYAREHLLPLAPKAAALVSGLITRARCVEELRTQKSADLWLFSSTGRVKLYETTPGERLAEICQSMGGEGFDLRDIRRTTETLMASMRIHKDIRSQLLSHGISGVQSKHYDRYAYMDEKRAALIAWEAKLTEIQRIGAVNY